jgi:O-methyltransferase involved in polyketide biosynthesis
VLEATATTPGQIVIVGAGYDDRSLRFPRDGIRFVEVDHPATQEDKCARLSRLGLAADDVRFVAMDLEAPTTDGLLDDALDPDVPTTVLAEAFRRCGCTSSFRCSRRASPVTWRSPR